MPSPRESAITAALGPSGRPAARLAALAVALAVELAVAMPAVRAAEPPWGWGNAGQAAAVWTPDNLADYLLTGQQPRPSVARIIAPEQGSTSLGSGVLVDVNRTQGLILTNWHVVRDSRSAVLVQFADGFQSAGTVVRWDEAWDLAALVIWKPAATPVTIAAAPPARGDVLTIAGFGRGPYREESGPCTDYLSPGGGLPQEFVELVATARQGDSGGPIFNDRGELAGVLFGENEGRTIGSCSTRVRSFLASVGSRGFVPTPIAEFSDARAIDRGIGVAAAVGPSDLTAAADQPVRRSTQVDAAPALPAAAPGEPLPPVPAAPSVGWPFLDRPDGPDVLAAAGGAALVILGIRLVLGGRSREPSA